MSKKAFVKVKPKNKLQIDKMAIAGQAAADLLDYLTDFIKPGVSTAEIDKIAYEWHMERNYTPAPLNYHGFPKSICTSINEVICHGIPSEKDILKDGDIVNVDVTVIVDGWHGDHSRMFLIGNVSDEDIKLVDVAYNSMMAGISQVKSGAYVSDIGKAINDYAAKLGYGVVENFCGHGIGQVFHENPQILNHDPKDPYQDCKLRTGMTFTVEPMINVGTKDNYMDKDDGWTIYTNDHKRSAQFEHTLVVTDSGYEILTKSKANFLKPPYNR